MMDLDSLSSLVDTAPEPPAVEGVERRGKQRRRRRRGAAIATTLAVLVVGVGTAAVIVSQPSTPHVAEVPPTDHVRVTLLDGSQMEISGPKSLGLEQLTPSFNAELDNLQPNAVQGHAFSVSRATPKQRGAVVGNYVTGDDHGLTLYATSFGVDAVARYGDWTLVSQWNNDQTNWSGFASALNARETADGFLVVDAALPGWRLGPTDAPDVQLNDADGNPVFSFFGPSTYPSGCPQTADAATRTPQGWPVSLTNGAWWCDANENVRVHVTDELMVDAAIDGLRVTHQPR